MPYFSCHRMIRIPLLLMLAASASAAGLPQRVDVTYDVSWNGMGVGKSTDRFEHNGSRYSIVSDTRTVGLAALLRKLSIHVESNGQILNGALRPLSFSEDRTKKPRRSAKFDWTRREITLDSGSGSQVVAMPDHPVYDRASFAWSFAFSLPADREGKLALTDGRKLSEYRYAVLGKKKIKTPAGEFDVLHVKKIQEEGDIRGFEVWLAIQQHYLPARIVFKDDDDTFDSVVSSLVYETKP